MSDDKLVLPNQDRVRISISQEYELQNWSQKFNVSAIELRDAVNQVGDVATDVARYLKTGINK